MSSLCPPEEWADLVNLFRHEARGSLRRAGIFLFLLLVASPTLIGRSCRRQLSAQTFIATAAQACAKGDLLPLPLHVDNETENVLQVLEQSGGLSGLDEKILDEVGTRCWLYAAIAVLNHQWHCPQSESGRDAGKLRMAEPGSSPTVNQVLSLQLLEEDVEDFLTDASGRDLDICNSQDRLQWTNCLQSHCARLEASGASPARHRPGCASGCHLAR